MAKKGRKSSGSMTPVWIILTIMVALVSIIATITFFGSAGSTGTTTTSTGELKTCGSEVTPDLLIKAFDSENKGNAVTEVFAYRKVGDTTWNSGTTGTELTGLEVDATYEFVLGINSSDQVDNAYGEKFTHTVKCQEDETIEFAMYNDEVETSLSATFYNKDSNAAAQSFSAGDEYVVSLRLKAGSDEFFGNPTLTNPNVLVLKLNSTEWDVPNKVYLADGTELKRVSTPLRYDSLVASGFATYAYELPFVSDKEVEIFLDMDADDSNAPANDGTAYIYAGGYFINDDSEVAIGVEDEEGVAVATDSPDSVTLDFIA